MAGCSEDKLGPDDSGKWNPGADDGDGVYMSVSIKLPTIDGSRSYTDDDNSSNGDGSGIENSGIEIGKDRENNVNSIYLVLAKQDYSFIGWGEIQASNIVKSTDGTEYKSTASFNKTQLANFYATLGENDSRDVCVFVFCNPTSRLRSILKQANEYVNTSRNKEWANGTFFYDASDPNAEVIWSDNNFLMSNSALAVRTLPATINDWEPYTDDANPFRLSNKNDGDNGIDNLTGRGAVKVERTAARFDFKDGSEHSDNLYHVIFPDNVNPDQLTKDEREEQCLINVRLNKMSLVNMNKQNYFLRRVSATGLYTIGDTLGNVAPNYVELCGPEKAWYSDANGNYTIENGNYVDGNYVVNYIAPQMNDYSIVKGEGLLPPYNFTQYFNYPFFNEEGEIDTPTLDSWFTSEIKTVLDGEKDNYKDNNYHIWRYVTENTIPGIDNQKNGQSTGIIFKGRILASDSLENNVDKNLDTLWHYLNNKPFTGEIKGPLTGDRDKDPIIYKFKGVKNNIGGMYATWPNVELEAKNEAIVPVWEADNSQEGGGFWKLEINRSNSLFLAVYGENGGCGSYTFVPRYSDGKPQLGYNDDGTPKTLTLQDPQPQRKDSPNWLWHEWDNAGRPVSTTPDVTEADLAKYYDFKRAAVKAGFTLYQSSYDGGEDLGYYCYYYYWNRHNDNGKNGIMGPMEFAVVRNNVYKISVKSIKNIGHPRITINDPDRPTPDTDDEIDDVFISVDVDVLPWVVRINDVQF